MLTVLRPIKTLGQAGSKVGAIFWQDVARIYGYSWRVPLFLSLSNLGKEKEKMKTSTKRIVALLLMLLALFSLASCANTVDKEGLWEEATYRRDMEFGKGDRTVTVVVTAGDSSVTFTVHTDKDTVGAALLEHELIDGEQGLYGLYVKKVNGITADYDVDQSYWAFYINGDYAMSGVELTEIDESAEYRLEYSR